MAKIKQTLNHRLKLAKAQRYVREHLREEITLKTLAEISGASPYHFIRVFNAYTAETPFEFMRRQKIIVALESIHLQDISLTALGFSLGFSSSSAFSKAFKAVVGMSATDFRNLGKDEQRELMHNVTMNPKVKELAMHLNFKLEPTIIERESQIIAFVEDEGPFEEIAPLVWQGFLSHLNQSPYQATAQEYLGISYVDEANTSSAKYRYQAAVTLPEEIQGDSGRLQVGRIDGGRYARFLLQGPYTGVWPAFKQAFAWLNEHGHVLAPQPCLENYLNDPTITPESELLTEILIPIQ